MADHHKTFVGELIHGEFKPAWQDFKEFLGAGESVAQALEKGWHGLPIELQNALVYGSGILNEIIADFDKVPPEIIKAIEDKFPSVDLNEVKEILQKILDGFTNVEGIGNLTLEETIQALQDYLKTLSASKSLFARILSQAAQTFASLLSPDSPFGKIVSYIETAYQVFIKKH